MQVVEYTSIENWVQNTKIKVLSFIACVSTLKLEVQSVKSATITKYITNEHAGLF